MSLPEEWIRKLIYGNEKDLEKLWHAYFVVTQGNSKELDGTFIICLEAVQINFPHIQLSRTSSHGFNILKKGRGPVSSYNSITLEEMGINTS